MLEKLKIWIPLVGVYFVAIDKEIQQSKKIGMLFVHLFFGIVILAMVSDPQPPEVKVVKDEVQEVVEEKKEEPKIDSNNLAKNIQKLANGNGNNWRAATDTEKVAFCMVSIKTLEKKEDVNLAVSLCKQLNIFYQKDDMINQEVTETSVGLYYLIKKGI
jgi:hypothetical protein